MLDLSFCPKPLNLVRSFINGPICCATLARTKFTACREAVTMQAIHGVFSLQDTKWIRLDQQFTAAFRAVSNYNLKPLKIA